MKANTRFPVAIHILTYIAIKGKGITSDELAKSVNTNPVVVRKLNANLKKAGLISIHNGPNGGAELKKSPQTITLLDVYQAVREEEDILIFNNPQHPNLSCAIGANIMDAINQPFQEAQDALKNVLAQYTVNDIVQFIKEKM